MLFLFGRSCFIVFVAVHRERLVPVRVLRWGRSLQRLRPQVAMPPMEVGAIQENATDVQGLLWVSRVENDQDRSSFYVRNTPKS